MKIPFHIPYVSGNEQFYLNHVLRGKHWHGDGVFTHKVQDQLRDQYGFQQTLLTPSCSEALELTAKLLGIGPGDEIIAPSFMMAASANPFVLRGARVVFADSRPDTPNLDETSLEQLITARTKAIVVVHYAGQACNMDKLLKLANKHKVCLIEDAALAIGATYKGNFLGNKGHFATFSFHHSQSISCGEGGALVINDPAYQDRVQEIRDRDLGRMLFPQGEIEHYSWNEPSDASQMSEFNAAMLYAQLQAAPAIIEKRRSMFQRYLDHLYPLQTEKQLQLPQIAPDTESNGHLFYVLTNRLEERNALMLHLRKKGIQSAFHYQALHRSPYYRVQDQDHRLPYAEKYSDTLLRLPLFTGITEAEVDYICNSVSDFYHL